MISQLSFSKNNFTDETIADSISNFKHAIIDTHYKIIDRDEFIKTYTLFNVPNCPRVSSERKFVEKAFKTLSLNQIQEMAEFGQRWLHWTIIRNEYCVCKALIERGYEVNLLNSKQETAMDVAYRMERYVFVELLLKYGGKRYVDL